MSFERSQLICDMCLCTVGGRHYAPPLSRTFTLLFSAPATLSVSPQSLRECFETKSVAKLHEVLATLTPEDASYHMQRCIDSGLWVADAKSVGLTPASETLQKELDEKLEPGQEVEMTPYPATPEDEKQDSGEHYEEVD